MTAYPERDLNPPEPLPNLEAEIEAISTDKHELLAVLKADENFLPDLIAHYYRRVATSGPMQYPLAARISEAIRDEAERRYGEHIKERGI